MVVIGIIFWHLSEQYAILLIKQHPNSKGAAYIIYYAF